MQKKRPRYENPATLADERKFQQKFESRFPDYILRKNPIQYRMDWCVLEKKTERVIAMIEYRDRKYTRYQIGKWGGIRVSLMKVSTALQIVETMGLPVRIFFRFKDCRDGEYWRFEISRENFQLCTINWMNMVKRNDPQDQEPVMMIPMNLLTKVQL